MWMTMASVVLLSAAVSGASQGGRPAEAVTSPYRVQFEDDQIRVLQLSVGAGEKGATLEHLDSVLIFLTRDLQGRMPAAEAVWRPAGTLALDNPGPGRFEAVLVELKGVPSLGGAGLPPEASTTATYERGGARSDDGGVAPYDVRAVRLLDNSRVTVTRQRFGPTARVDLFHFHTRDNLFVYLGRGEVAGATARWGRHRVERGQVDVLPPNILHVFSNAGSDPIEFITIHPK